MYEDLQSSRTKFDLEHLKVICAGVEVSRKEEEEELSRSIGKHLRRGDGIGNKRK